MLWGVLVAISSFSEAWPWLSGTARFKLPYSVECGSKGVY